MAKADGSPLVRLGDGSAMGITPDGKSIIALLPSTNSTFRLLPTGAGETRTFEVSPVHALDYYGNWVRDGTKFVFLGSEPGKKTRAYLLDTTTGKASAVNEMSGSMVPSGVGFVGSRAFTLLRSAIGILIYDDDTRISM